MSTRDTIGILGGMGPKSTAPFLDAVIRQCQVQYAATTDIDFPPIMVYSLPTPFCLDRPIDHTLMERTIIRGLQRLEATGVAYIAMPCNSAHIYYEALARSVSVPLLNMISETVAQAPLGACVTLVATPITHESKLYQQGLERLGINFVFEPSWMPRIVELISTIKATTDLRIAKGKWLRLQEALLQRGVTTAIIACTDLNAVTDAAAGIIERIDSAEALAAATVREYCRRTENHSKPL